MNTQTTLQHEVYTYCAVCMYQSYVYYELFLSESSVNGQVEYN